MTGGSVRALGDLPGPAAFILEGARRAVLTTADAAGNPHAVPVCFIRKGAEIFTPIDHKPKSGKILARVRNIEATGRATLLADRWDEDWARLGWVMVKASARIEESDAATEELFAQRYPQYRKSPHHDAMIVLTPGDVLWWTYS